VEALEEELAEEEKISIPRGATACLPEQRGLVACTADYAPVCGNDEKTYSNICGACSNDTVEFHIPGECKGDTLKAITSSVVCTDEQKAAEICTADYTPVCGNDGETYGNTCGACSSGKINSYVSGECSAS